MLEYGLRVKNSKAHTFHVTLRIPRPLSRQSVSLPVWIPGSYLVREFSKHLSFLKATQGGKSVKITQQDKCTWEVDSKENDLELELSWQIYAFDTSVRAAYLDQFRGFVNGTSVFLRAHGFEKSPVKLSLYFEDEEIKNWAYACALPEIQKESQKTEAFAVLQAQNYDELVDSPIELGQFWRGQFKILDVMHELVVTGTSATFDGERLIEDTRLICEEVVRFWGERKSLPYQRYVFMLNAVDSNYGGLEHCASTALICKRDDLPRQGERSVSKELRKGYQNLLTLICHEFFHTWHVKRMRPATLERYDYSQENYIEFLWFFEGVTSYYEYVLAHRAGLLTQEQFLHWLGQDLASVEGMPGRQVQTVAQASFDAWIKFYRVDENTRNATVNYYTKGAMVALCLDLTLRQENTGSLDMVMQELWRSSQGGPVAENDILMALQKVGGRSYAREVREWVHGLKELPVEKLLRYAGVKIVRKQQSVSQKLGVVMQGSATNLILKTVLKDSVAENAGLAVGDELIAVNGWRLKDINLWDVYVPQGAAAEILLARDAKMVTLQVQPTETGKGCPELQMRNKDERRGLPALLKMWPQK